MSDEEPPPETTGEPEDPGEPEPDEPEPKPEIGAADPEEPASRLQDADPDEEQERDNGEQQAFDMRVANLRGEMFGDTHQHGEHGKIYQAQSIVFASGGASPRPRVGPLPARTLRALRRTYARSPSCTSLLDGFGSAPVQALIGSRGTGRTTTALYAVMEHLAPASSAVHEDPTELTDRVHMIEAESGLEGFHGDAAPKNSGLVLVLGSGESAPGAGWLGEVGRSLKERGSVLVVVADTQPAGSTVVTTENVVTYEPPPNERVLARYLQADLGEDEVDRLMALPVVRTELARCHSPRETATYALELIAGVHEGRTPEDVVQNRDPTEAIAEARKELASERRTFLIACAVLDGLDAGTVVPESERLAKLQGVSLTKDIPISDWSACADIRSAGGGDGNTVHLVHPRLASKILEVAWQEQVGLRGALLPWLKDLAVHQDMRVRVKAAQAMARLATYDFKVIRREVLRVWAADGGYRTRQAVAWTLEALALAEDGRFAGRVRGLVSDWVRSRDVCLQAAGVAAYGTFLGAEYPDSALKAMRRIAGGRLQRLDRRRGGVERAERELSTIVEKAILDVFLAGAYEKVVGELADWTRLPFWRWRRCAATCLVRLSKQDGGLPGWPMLMELADGQARFRADVAQLWRNALNEEHRSVNAWPHLRRLINLAETADRRWPAAGDPDDWSDEALRFHALVRRLLTDIAAGSGPADAKRVRTLRFHVTFWEFQDGRQLTVIPDSLRN
ncbi:hypothetical protein [Nonomuraea sp. NPDC050540]|uniref:hypothetical protein n=1 Tax=Nonomuraea sp. NPDC050540 TaxID=3364367 RepID=UPI0037B5131C